LPPSLPCSLPPSLARCLPPSLARSLTPCSLSPLARLSCPPVSVPTLPAALRPCGKHLDTQGLQEGRRCCRDHELGELASHRVCAGMPPKRPYCAAPTAPRARLRLLLRGRKRGAALLRALRDSARVCATGMQLSCGRNREPRREWVGTGTRAQTCGARVGACDGRCVRLGCISSTRPGRSIRNPPL